MTFTYSDNQQLKTEFKNLIKDKNLSMVEISKRLGLSTPQQLNNKLNNKRFSFDDLKQFLDVIDCEFEITFKNKKGKDI